MEPVRVCFIGCGGHSSANLYPHFCRIPELKLVACCDLIEEKAKGNAKQFGADAWYTDYEKMLDAEKPDAVFIVGHPDTMHTELGIACFEKGYHVFTEKPSANSVDGARRVAEAMKKSGKFGQVGHMMRHGKLIKKAKEILNSGDIGKLTYVESKYYTGPAGASDWDAGHDWGYMCNQAVHPVDLIRHFGGDVANLSARRATKRGSFAAVLQFKNGACGFLNLNEHAPGWESRLELTADKGGFISIENMNKMQYLHPDEGAWDMRISRYQEMSLGSLAGAHPGYTVGYLAEMQDFGQAILSSIQPYPTHEDAYQCIRVCEAILKSAESGQPVEL